MAEDRMMTPADVVAKAMSGEHGDLLRDAVALVVRELMEAEVAELRLPGRARDLRPVPGARRAVRRFAADVVHIQDYIGNDPRLVVVAGVRPGRYALTVHDPSVHPGDEPPPRLWLQRELTRRAGVVFVHGERLVAEVREVSGTRAPVVVVPHGADPPEALPLPDSPTLLFFGRVSAYKGLDVLLDAMPAIRSRVPDVRLVVAGEGDYPSHPGLQDPGVTVIDRHVPEDDLPGLFGGASLVVLPYIQASQSGVATLAKRFGRAIVATDVGGLAEAIPRDQGVIVAPGSPGDLAAGVLNVLADRAALAAMGDAAAATAGGGASWPAVAQATVAAYEDYLLR